MVAVCDWEGILVDSKKRHTITPRALYPLVLPVLVRSGRLEYILNLLFLTVVPKIKFQLTPDELAELASHKSDHEIGELIGVRQGTVRYHRIKNEIPSFTEQTGNMKMRSDGTTRRRGTHSKESSDSLVVDYFDTIDSPEKAYWIGVLATDGCVSENSRISLSQTIDDSVLVERFAATLGATRFLKTKVTQNSSLLSKSKKSVMRICRFTSKQVAKSLEKQNVTHRKTHTLELSACAYLFPEAYLLGCLDGDGSVGKINFHFSSASEKWIDQARDLIYVLTEERLQKYHRISKDTGKGVFVLQGVRNNVGVLRRIYSVASECPCLDRKLSRFETYWLFKTASYWKDKVGFRAFVDPLPSVLDSGSTR